MDKTENKNQNTWDRERLTNCIKLSQAKIKQFLAGSWTLHIYHPTYIYRLRHPPVHEIKATKCKRVLPYFRASYMHLSTYLSFRTTPFFAL